MRATVRFFVQWGLIAGLTYFVVRYLESQWAQIDLEFEPRNLALLAGSLAVYVLGMALLPYNSWKMQRWLGYDLSAYTVWRSFYIAQFVKYLPGGIWSIPGRAVMYHRAGVSATDSGALVLLEILGMIVGSCLVGLTSVPIFIPLVRDFAVPLLIAGAAGTAAVALAVRATRNRWSPALRFFATREFAAACLVYAANWVVLGIAFVLIATALGLPVAVTESIEIIGIHAVAWVIGFLVVFSPGGIGVRDAILAFGLVVFFPIPFPVIISLLARIGWTLAEIGGYLLIVPFLPHSRNKAV